ncbi:phage portal protein [Pseudomonas asiatica]|uniref:phage portal protein n=1 Tax=Pseudomonas asiatica TaxID=2219225 RepID=UPI003523192C
MKKLFRLFTRSNNTPAYDRYFDQFSQAGNSAGVNITVQTAESISAVYAAVAAISESVGSLPLDVYRRTDDGRDKARSHPLYALLHDAPNEWQTALEFREQLQRHILLRGNAYARIRWSGAGRVQALEPVNPDSVSILRSSASERLVYEYTDRHGKLQRLTADEMLHIKFHSDDGVLGRSPIQVARDTLGLALAERTHGTMMFAQGTKLSGVIETAPGTTKEQATQIRESWAAGQAGVNNHGKTPVLPQGAKYSTVAMTLEDASWIEARRLSVEEVARLFRVPPVLIGDLREANYSNAVELGRYFVTHTLRRHLVAWEQAINRTLLGSGFFAEHNVEGLLRGDSLNRAQFYQRGIEDRWLLPSEVRRMENLPPVEGIDDEQETKTPDAQAPGASDRVDSGRKAATGEGEEA